VTFCHTGLIITAGAEAQIATYEGKRFQAASAPSDTRPATASLSQLIPTLLKAIDSEADHAQDAFQAITCLGWLHWVLDEPQLAVARLPKDFTTVLQQFNPSIEVQNWTRVCIIKGAYMKGKILLEINFQCLNSFVFRLFAGKKWQY
jgi:cargo-transport protein YPP1